MPQNPDTLPRFKNPPVDEVALGVQFNLPGFLPTHYGAFHDRVKAQFPIVQSLPALPPAIEAFSTGPSAALPGLMSLLSLGAQPLPRVLFVSDDDTSLIQLQSDRLYFNWRKRANGVYPHYSHFRGKFSEVYTAFEAFLVEHSLGPVGLSQCDVLYVNPLTPDVTGVSASSPDKVFRSWNAHLGEEWSNPLEDLSFNARYRLLNQSRSAAFGRLTVTMSTGVTNAGIAQMRLELTARGTPLGSGLDGILAFHDAGHDAIVRCFTAITTDEMHTRWGRLPS